MEHNMSEFPPFSQLLRIAMYAPLTVELYLKLWAARDIENSVVVIKATIFQDWKMSNTVFYNRISRLCKMEILDYIDIDKGTNLKILFEPPIEKFGDAKIPC